MKRSMVAIALLAAMGALGSSMPPRKVAARQVRTPADILRRREKQAAKLARRAARTAKAKTP